MNRHVMMALGAALMATAAGVAVARAQQPTAEYYDTTKTVTIKGTLRLTLVTPPPAPMIIGLEVSGAKDRKEMYFLAGNPATALRRDGYQLIGPGQAIKSGDVITVTAFLPKDQQKAAKALGAIIHMPGSQPPGPPGFVADVEANRARLAYGLEITKADGEKLRFGDVP